MSETIDSKMGNRGTLDVKIAGVHPLLYVINRKTGTE